MLRALTEFFKQQLRRAPADDDSLIFLHCDQQNMCFLLIYWRKFSEIFFLPAILDSYHVRIYDLKATRRQQDWNICHFLQCYQWRRRRYNLFGARSTSLWIIRTRISDWCLLIRIQFTLSPWILILLPRRLFKFRRSKSRSFAAEIYAHDEIAMINHVALFQRRNFLIPDKWLERDEGLFDFLVISGFVAIYTQLLQTH